MASSLLIAGECAWKGEQELLEVADAQLYSCMLQLRDQ